MTASLRPLLIRQLVQLLVWGSYMALMAVMGSNQAGHLTSGLVLIAFGVGGGLWASSEILRALALRRGWLQRSGPALAGRIGLCVLLLPAATQLILYVLIIGGMRLQLITMPGDEADYRPGSIFIYWLNTAILLGLWTAAWISIQAMRRFRQGEMARLRSEAARSALELDALRARLNPHFVFNALNNLRALINEDAERARELVTRLSNTLRHALDHGEASSVSLKHELDVVRDYLEVERVHYEDRLQIETVIGADAPAASLPPMLLQLLVENAIKHGIARTPGGGVVRIAAHMRDGRLHIEVQNPGALGTRGDGHGVGLAYLRARLARTLPGARFALEAHDGNVRATLEIPQA
jgi:LytS/YehU family sensor histidine kinase